MKKLTEILSKWEQKNDVGHGDKNTTHSYGDVYEELLSPYRKNSNILEIGLAYGESLEVWYEYFIDSKIYGLDIQDNEIKNYLSDTRFIINICDATTEDCLKNYKDIKFDVIIDDASHKLEDQMMTYNLIKNNLNENGIYIIEDAIIDSNYNEIYKNLNLEKQIDIIDLRHKKNRRDDVLIVIKNKK